MTLVWKDLD